MYIRFIKKFTKDGYSAVHVLRCINKERMMFSQIPEKCLEGRKSFYKLDFVYSPKGKKVGTDGKHTYFETSMGELDELTLLEEEAAIRIADAKKAAEEKTRKYFDRLQKCLHEEDMQGGEGGSY